VRKSILSPILLVGILLTNGPSLHAAITLPFSENFSSGTEGLNADPLSPSLEFRNFVYSVDGTGGVALYNTANFLGISLDNFSGLGVIGDWQWSGATTHNVHNFTVASNDSSRFALTYLDWATGNGGPPTLYTITAYRGATQVAQLANINITTAGTYGSGSANEIVTTGIGPGDDSGYGLGVSFTGNNWKNIDRFVFSATGNDILVALDNIQLTTPIPEPSGISLLACGMAFATMRRRRSAQLA
jgi:hypothetical protein